MKITKADFQPEHTSQSPTEPMNYYVDVYEQLNDLMEEAKKIDSTITKVKVTFHSEALRDNVEISFP